MADHNDEPQTAAEDGSLLQPPSRFGSRQSSIDEGTVSGTESMSEPVEAMALIKQRAPISIESMVDAKDRFEQNQRDREEIDKVFKKQWNAILKYINVGYLNAAQQADARDRLNEAFHVFKDLMAHAENTQVEDYEQRQNLMQGLSVVYGEKASSSGGWKPAKAQTKSSHQQQSEDQDQPKRHRPDQQRGRMARPPRKGQPAALNMDAEASSKAQESLETLLSDGETGGGKEAVKLERDLMPDHQEEEKAEPEQRVEQTVPPTSDPSGEPTEPLRASGSADSSTTDKPQNTVSADHQEEAPLNTRDDAEEVTFLPVPDSHASECLDEKCREREHRPHGRQRRVVIPGEDEDEETVHLPVAPTLVSLQESRKQGFPSARNAPNDMLVNHSTSGDVGTPDDVKAVLEASSASLMPEPENPPESVKGDHDGPSSPAHTAKQSSSSRSSISDSMEQSPNGTRRPRNRSSLFRESFLVEEVGPSWSPRSASYPPDADSDDGGWQSVLAALFDASCRFLVRQLLPWLHFIIFLGTLTYACFFSGFEFVFAFIQFVCLRFEVDLTNPLPAPVISEVPERSRLVIATHLMAAWGSLALVSAYKLERERESWLKANGLTRALFVDYLRGVSRWGWRDIAPLLLRGFEIHQSRAIGKLYISEML